MKKQISSATRILESRYYRGKPARQAALLRERERCDVAQKVYDLRKSLGLSQEHFAAKVGMKPSAISRLESGDYNRPSLSTLQRIAAALNQRVEISFVAVGGKRRVA
jgi:DNA-binding XRE family transcriptional regulator